MDQPMRSNAASTRLARVEGHCAIVRPQSKRPPRRVAAIPRAPAARLTREVTAPAHVARPPHATDRTPTRREAQALPRSNAHPLPGQLRLRTSLHYTARLLHRGIMTRLLFETRH